MSGRESPKRPAAHSSVCLRSSPSKRLKATSDQRFQAHQTPISPLACRPATSRHFPMHIPQASKRREMVVERPDAEQWFNETNRNVSSTVSSTLPDDDPPFHLKPVATSYPDSACAVRSDQSSHSHVAPDQRGAPTELNCSQFGSSQSDSEAFRDVIDDLTIQNKKLRKRLKKYETLHCSHLQDEKLFEIKYYGLPANKKRELDNFLRAFALSVEKPPGIPSISSSRQPRQQSSSLPDPLSLPSSKKPSSSTTSNSKPVDSAYASMSNSGQTQNSNPYPNDKSTTNKPVSTAPSKQEHVKSYLDDMPRGLMPKYSLVMSKRSKRKLVVRRLEEVYVGKGAASSEHGQSHQQQEVSQSAAKADRSALEAGGCRARAEGLREARISILDVDVLTEHTSDAILTSRKEINDGDESTSRDAHASQDGTPDQRPTRPLDLDPYRAQVPADNIQYIRHLGLVSPTLKADPYTSTLNGWVYLNLLMSMAQLHTLNVTLEFVRKSIVDMSTTLELSPDGRKIRWKGGTEGSKIPSDSDSSVDGEIGTSLEGRSNNKRRKLDGSNPNESGHDIIADLTDISQYLNARSSANLGGSTKLRPIFLEQVSDAPSFDYKPLFYHGTSSEEGDDVPPDNIAPVDIVDDELGAQRTSNTQGGDQTRLARHKKGENGPTIFYNRARFCTDMSRDIRASLSDVTKYSRFSQEPVGFRRPNLHYSDFTTEAPKGPLTEGSVFEEPMDLDEDNQNTTESLLVFADTGFQDNESTHAVPISMEASGLSGVRPMDHFSIEVRVENTLKDEPSMHHISALATSRIQANRLLQRPSPSVVPTKNSLTQSTIVSVNVRNLPPSSLPPPSYIYLQASSSENTENSNNNEVISESHSGKRALPSSTADDDGKSAKPISSFDSFGGTREESSYNTSSAAESDDSSIDLLAHARELDPETIAAREMEFDRNARQQLVEVPAGSSAATAGGGSGYSREVSSVNGPNRLSRASRSSAERRTGSLGTDRSDRGHSSCTDATFVSSGMEESD